MNKTTCTTRKRHIDHIDEDDDDEGSKCKKRRSLFDEHHDNYNSNLVFVLF